MVKTGTQGLNSRIIRVSYPLLLNLHILRPAYSRRAHWERREKERENGKEKKERGEVGRERDRQSVYPLCHVDVSRESGSLHPLEHSLANQFHLWTL